MKYETNDLKNCPFCETHNIDIRKRKTVIITCRTCGVLFIKMTVEAEKERWNKRFMEEGFIVKHNVMHNALNLWLKAGVSNSTDFELQRDAYLKTMEALHKL
jgi:hypothetical protein